MTGKDYVYDRVGAICDLLFYLVRQAQKVTLEGRLEYGSQIDEIAGWIADAYEAGYKDGRVEETENDQSAV